MDPPWSIHVLTNPLSRCNLVEVPLDPEREWAVRLLGYLIQEYIIANPRHNFFK
jgi:hypothetical protein